MTTSLQQPTGQRRVLAPFLVQLLYLPWLVLMFGLGYVAYSIVGLEAGADVMADAGVAGWVVSVGYFVLLALPNWVGAALAVRERTGGGGPAATFALWQNLVVGVAVVAVGLIIGL